MAKCKVKNPRLGVVGGQAVIEGVMMKSGDNMAIASRLSDGSIKISKERFVSARQKNKFLNLPIIRGCVNFVEMMKLSFKTMDTAASALGIEDEEPSKFEKWLAEKLHMDVMTFATIIGGILGIALSVGLFIFLPSAASSGLSALISWITGGKFVLADHPILFAIIEGIVKIAIFLGYLTLVSLMKDIRRVFEYHGAEHKSVFCYEAGEELTPENVKKFSRFHPRCGTSFMFFMMIIGIIIGCFIPTGVFLRPLWKLLLLPFTVGIGYEIIRFAGCHDNIIIRAVSAPGLWVQRITTKEPDEKQIECAIAALKSAIPAEFPDYDPADQFGPFEDGAKAKEKSGGMKLVFAYKRKIERENDAHRRVALRQMSKKEQARYRQKEKR